MKGVAVHQVCLVTYFTCSTVKSVKRCLQVFTGASLNSTLRQIVRRITFYQTVKRNQMEKKYNFSIVTWHFTVALVATATERIKKYISNDENCAPNNKVSWDASGLAKRSHIILNRKIFHPMTPQHYFNRGRLFQTLQPWLNRDWGKSGIINSHWG